MSKNNTSAAFREGTPAAQQKAAFDYLRERCRTAHNEGDGLLASHLSILALDEATKLLKSNKCHLFLPDLKWAFIFSHYWLINGYLLDNDIAEFLSRAPRKNEVEGKLLNLLRIYSRLVKEPLWSDPEDLSFLQAPYCDWMEASGAPEDLALAEHLAELVWFRDPQGDSWGKVIHAWAAAANIPGKCKQLLARLERRLRLQSALTIPGSLYPSVALEDAEKWAADFPEAEIWIHTLHGNRPGVEAAVTRRLPFVSDDPVLVRQLLDLQRFNFFHGDDQDPQAVSLTRRRLFDSPLLRFDETREQFLSETLGAIFQRNEVGQAYRAFQGVPLSNVVRALCFAAVGFWHVVRCRQGSVQGRP